MTALPLTPDELERLRAEATAEEDAPGQHGEWMRITLRLLATLDAERDAARTIGKQAEASLTPTGDHHALPDGYCLDCQGGCIGPLAAENTEAIKQAAYAGPSPFEVPHG